MATKMKTFNVMMKGNIDVYYPITAKDLDDAFVKAKEIKQDDVVSVNGDLIDSDIRAYGVFEA